VEEELSYKLMVFMPGEDAEENEPGAAEEPTPAPESKLAAVRQRMLHTAIYACAGWILLMFVLLFNSLMGFWAFILFIAAAVIASWPMLRRMQAYGFTAVFQSVDSIRYNVITTYGDGRKSSDGGSEAAGMRLFFTVLVWGIMLTLGIFLTLIYLVYLIIAYVIRYLVINPKPAFGQTAFPIIIAGFLVLLGTPLIIAPFSNAAHAKSRQAHFSGTEIRNMIGESQRLLFAAPFSYSIRTPYNLDLERADAENARANVTVTYNNAANITTVNIAGFGGNTGYMVQFDRGNINLLPGTYTFRDNTFVEYADAANHFDRINRTPDASHIELARAYLPANFIFNPLNQINDNDLWAQKQDTRISIRAGNREPRISITINSESFRLERFSRSNENATIVYN
jgi:hypothetical protein